jgi:hypothetical protein
MPSGTFADGGQKILKATLTNSAMSSRIVTRTSITGEMKLVEVIPGKKLVWLVLDNFFNFTEDKSEWKGTKVIFEVSKTGDKTEIHFTHQSLVPRYECFNVCSNAWGSYINGSLRSLIETGKGRPNPKEKGERTKAS